MEEVYELWLCSAPGIYTAQLEQLLKFFRTAKNIFEATEQEFEPWKQRECKWIEDFLQYRRTYSPDRIRHRIQRMGIQFISREQAGFPEKLKQLSDCPIGLFYKGRLPEAGLYSVAVIGARSCSNYGRVMAREISGALTGAGVQIVSGLACGIDGYAQAKAVEEGGSSFGVLGCGVDLCYPEENFLLYEHLQRNGGIVSEFAPGSPPLRHHFPMRNRIISGLSDAVIVVEARKKSGSLITADLALDQGKDVYAVPGRNGDLLSYGCNHLIEQGAGLILSVDSLLEHLNLSAKFKKSETETKKKKQLLLAPDENLLYSNLNLRPKSLQELSEKSDISIPVTARLLFALEEKGLVAEISKNHYVRVK